MIRRIVFFFILMNVTGAGATELFDYNVPIRARGMGGVYAPFPAETDAILINPAYLATVGEIGWDIMNLGVGINDLTNAQSFSSLSSASGTSSYSGLFGKSVTVNGNGRTSVVFPFIGIAAYDNLYLSAEMNSPPFPDLNLKFFNDSGFMLGFGLPLGPGLSWGATLKRIQRWGGEGSIGLSSLAAGSSTNLQNTFQDVGAGWGVDTSLMLKVPGFFSPTLVAAWKDVGSTAFTLTNGSTAPPRIKDNLILGAGLLMDLPGFDWRVGTEYWHVTDNGEQLGKKLHMGTEFSLPLIDLRAGVSQGYQSYGAGINLWFLKIDAAYYKVEKGDYPGQNPDIRMEANLSLQVAVDADFTFTTKDGKRRRLKQRR